MKSGKEVIDFVTKDRLLSHKKYKQMCRAIIHDFDTLPITDEEEAQGRHRRRDSGQVPPGCQQSSGGSSGVRGRGGL